MAKYLFSDFKAKAVVVGKKKLTLAPQEFIYDTDGESLAINQMKEAAKASGFKLTGKKKNEVISSFNDGLKDLNLPEIEKMAKDKKKTGVSKDIMKIVEKGVKDGMEENEILIAIVNSGVKFAKALPAYKAARVELGYDVSPKERKKKAFAIMDDEGFDPETFSEVEEMAKLIADSIKGTTSQNAMALIRAFAKENEISLPKKPKGTKKTPLILRIIKWIMENEGSSKSEFIEWLENQTNSENIVENWSKNYVTLFPESE